MIQLVEDVGFLPFFTNHIPGFSVEECCPRELWFAEGVDGPWEWKGPVARSGHGAADKIDKMRGIDMTEEKLDMCLCPGLG